MKSITLIPPESEAAKTAITATLLATSLFAGLAYLLFFSIIM